MAFDRYAGMMNNPVRYTDPSGHSIDCAVGEQYCEAGNIDHQERALNIAESKRKQSNTRTNWVAITNSERSILAEGGWDEGSYNAHIYDEGAVSDAEWYQDPAFYVSAAFGGARLGGKILSEIVAGACLDGNCSNEVRVFWSGGSAARDAALEWAKENNGINLNQTFGGRLLDFGTKFLPYEKGFEPLWKFASRRFAEGASGQAHVFINTELYSTRSIWSLIESPALVNKNNVEMISHILGIE